MNSEATTNGALADVSTLEQELTPNVRVLNTQAEKWAVLESYVTADGLALYDVEFANATAGVLRVLVCGAGSKPGPVAVEQCSSISHRILDSEFVEQLMPGNVTLEVSSPGVNRKLTRPEHFPAAVGERVKLKLKEDRLGLGTVLVGQLIESSDISLKVVVEVKGSPSQDAVDVPLEIIRDARVNFKF